EPEPEPEPTPTPRAGLIARTADNGASLDALRTEMLGRMTALEARPPRVAGGPLARYASFREFADAAYNDPEQAPLLARALVDQITSLNPGVIPPAWVNDVAGIMEFARPAVIATGGARGLGDSGMEVDWPYLD